MIHTTVRTALTSVLSSSLFLKKSQQTIAIVNIIMRNLCMKIMNIGLEMSELFKNIIRCGF